MCVTGVGATVEAERAAGSTTEAGAARQGGAGSVLPALPAVTAAGGTAGQGGEHQGRRGAEATPAAAEPLALEPRQQDDQVGGLLDRQSTA